MSEFRVDELGRREFKNFCQMYDDEFLGLEYNELIFSDFVDRINTVKEDVVSNGGRKFKELSKYFGAAKDALIDAELDANERRRKARYSLDDAIHLMEEKEIWASLGELRDIRYDITHRYCEAR
ncbi:MAG: hypothetical protein ABIF85_04335 [Nanoarchaeota archaeon]|nr:hypothetical protein [Nanoarchaeota archaeon]MBU4300629.1 hypothetical protein [Nanoarchaeota archaeon]MBU4452182.1 hypothetical protein [Nanoarchaeota archaeon]MCG2724222.1 hypothetical protein [archaeon]